MKVIRIIALGAALLVGGTSVAHAQSEQPSSGMQQRQGRMMEMLMKGITLTDAQKAQIDSIQAKYRSEMPAMTPGQRPDSQSRAARREAMQKESADIRAVLTPDQQKVYDQNVADMRSRMGRRGGRSGR